MTDNNFFTKLIKVFSMKNDTVEDARERYKRALACIPFSIVPMLFMIFLSGVQMSSFTEGFCFIIFVSCLPSSFVAMSSVIAPIKAAIAFAKWFISKPLAGVLVLLYPLAIVVAICVFVYIICSAFVAPVFLTIYGVYKSKKHLEELENQEEVIAY